MPELPEVEIIKRGLVKKIKGKKLHKFFIFDKKRLKEPVISLPRRINSICRHGKYIVWILDSNYRCLLHLRMTGRLLFDPPSAKRRAPSERPKHERAAFLFSDGSRLRFVDARRFGTIEWPKKDAPLPHLGPDPLSGGFTSHLFAPILANSRRPIKSLLLDQKALAGIGNIYADESLWLTKIKPTRKSGSLTSAEIGRLVAAIKKVLREAIKKGGFTFRDYRRIDGSLGYYQRSRKVYDREGLPCLRCRAKIKRIKVGGRSSYFCPKCQK